MKPGDLQPSSFAPYPESSRALAIRHLALLRAMPLALLPSYLVQLREFPALFPREQSRLIRQLDALQTNPELMRAFEEIHLPTTMEHDDWLHHPAQFVATLSEALWQSGDINRYHRAAEQLFAALPAPEHPPTTTPPLLLAAIGQGSTPGSYPLFTRLRSVGLYARKVDEARLSETLLRVLAQRAAANPAGYIHWYVDGGEPWPTPATTAVQRFTYPSLASVTDAVLREMDRAVREGTGPELLADRLRGMHPEALGLPAVTTDPRMQRFFVSLLTQGSGTQLYSTSFVQAAAVELVRRTEPQTILLRFAPRRKLASLNDMLEQRGQSTTLDPDGALIDADMAVYYAYLALKSQPGGEHAQLAVFAEGHGEAFLAGPGVTHSGESSTPLSVAGVLDLLS